MKKVIFILSLISASLLSDSQTLHFSTKATTFFLDKTKALSLKSYHSDTIQITLSGSNDTVMVYHYDSLIAFSMLDVFNAVYPANDHTPKVVRDLGGYYGLWVDFLFASVVNVNPRDLLYERFIVYLKNNPSIQDTVTFYLQFAPTGIITNTLSGEKIIFPNPAYNEINLSSDFSEIRIIDALGREVLRGNISIQRKVDISNLAPGIYYFEGSTKSGVVCDKFVIRNF